jgi:hypothetical protein
LQKLRKFFYTLNKKKGISIFVRGECMKKLLVYLFLGVGLIYTSAIARIFEKKESDINESSLQSCEEEI